MGLQVFSVIAVVKKTTMLTETPVRFDSVDHHAGLNDNLGINSTISLRDKASIRG